MEAASSNAALMRRIVQLESERDDLRKDVENLCMQQSGQHSVASSFMAPLQARRLAGLEQELESCRQKVSMYKRENANLQDELSEVYHIKAQVSDLCKTESEKNTKLEEELKFFQSKVAASMGERDRLVLEIERSRTHEQALEGELRDCHRKNKEILQENQKYAGCLDAMRDDFDRLNFEVEVYHQVIKRFWQMRVPDCANDPNTSEMARCLLADPEDSWTFGIAAQTKTELEEKAQSLESVIVDLSESKAESARLQSRLTDEVKNREEAAFRAADSEKRLIDYRIALGNTFQELKECQKSLKDDISAILTNEVKPFEAALSSFEKFAQQLKPDEATAESRVVSDVSDTGTSSEVTISQEDFHAQPTVSREAFLQALHEKVGALMLLSQEEERHHLEVVTTGALEYQIRELSRKLSQVTLEKVEALVQVAQLKYDCQELKDRERELLRLLQNPSGGGRLLPATWAGGTIETVVAQNTQTTIQNQTKKKTSITGNYLKSWLRGGDLYGFISNQTENSSTPIDRARTRVENAALQERLTSLQQLIRLANRLRTTLSGAEDRDSVTSSLEVVNGAYDEAQRLKAALGCCNLPVSCSDGEGKISLTEETTDDKAVLELVSAAAMALLELLISTAELQRAALMRQA